MRCGYDLGMQPSEKALVDGHRPGRVPRAVRAQQLLEIADQLFIERGFHATSMDEIARRAGVSKPVIYDHFESKEQLFAACARRAGEELAERVRSAALKQRDPRERLRAGSFAYFGFVQEQYQAWALLFADEQVVRDARIAAEASRIRHRQAKLMVSLMAETFDITPEHPGWQRLEAMTITLAGGYESLSLWWSEHPDVSVDQLVDWIIDLALPGIERILTELLASS